MKRRSLATIAAVTLSLALGVGTLYAQNKDKYALKVPGGLSASDFRGFESWQTISISENGPVVAVILGNPQMIQAMQSGIPENGKPFPDGARMAKIHWLPKTSQNPGNPKAPDKLTNVDFMVKDSKQFADSGGWGYGAFEYNAATEIWRPATTQDYPPQSNDTKCGFGCHSAAKARDYVFTEYARR